jgi:hypothetical protein
MSDTPAKKKPRFVVYQHWPEHVHMLPHCRLCGAPVTCASVLECETPDGKRVQATICRSHLASAAVMRTDPSVAEIAAGQALVEIQIRRLTAGGQRPAVVRLPTQRFPARPAASPSWPARVRAMFGRITDEAVHLLDAWKMSRGPRRRGHGESEARVK